MRDSFLAALESELEALNRQSRLRALTPLAGASRTNPTLGGSPVLSFCSNDYLGLANHPALARAAAEAAHHCGLGAGASRLISGDLPEHRALETALASFVGLPAALLFPTGYQANLGLFSALAGPDDLIVSDAANHASLIDGCRLSRAQIAVYRHGDAGEAEAAFAAAATTHRSYRRRFLVTESLFSMDGDVAPLASLAEVAAQHDAIFVVDEAHALGVLGPSGRGLSQAARVEPDVLVGTLGKALGVFGGFVAGSAPLRAVLVNRARTFIFTTAPPPAIAAAASAALALVASHEGETRRQRLASRLAELRAALPLPESALPSPIVPLLLGSDTKALAASHRLREQGILIPAIRPPTVPEGTARLRVTLSAAHESMDIQHLARALRPLLLPRP